MVSQRMEDGVFHLTFDLEPTEKVLDVRAAREHRSEARSVERLLNPVGVAVIGASRTPGRIGHELLRHLRDYGSQGPLYAIHPEADSILGVPAYRHITDIPQPVDLAVVAVPADAVLPVVAECAAAGVSGLGRGLLRVRRHRHRRGPRAPAPTGAHRAGVRHAGRGPELPGDHQHRPAREPERQPVTAGARDAAGWGSSASRGRSG